jgi:hypothetical protein
MLTIWKECKTHEFQNMLFNLNHDKREILSNQESKMDMQKLK